MKYYDVLGNFNDEVTIVKAAWFVDLPFIIFQIVFYGKYDSFGILLSYLSLFRCYLLIILLTILFYFNFLKKVIILMGYSLIESFSFF